MPGYAVASLTHLPSQSAFRSCPHIPAATRTTATFVVRLGVTELEGRLCDFQAVVTRVLHPNGASRPDGVAVGAIGYTRPVTLPMPQPNRTRSLALVGPLVGQWRVAQTAGFPIDPSQMLPAPDVILPIAGAEPAAMLFRYTAHGEFGDTWHASVDSAREQAAFEYD